MDDSFAYRTTVPIRRQVDPFLVKAGAWLALVVVSIAVFASWVIASERRSFERLRPAGTAEPSRPAVAWGAGAPEATVADAEQALLLAADAATAALAADGTFLTATPARLERTQPGAGYRVGPSTAADLVSVAATADVWAAAVLAPDGTCLWIRVARDGTVARDAGAECTGSAALAAPPSS